MRGAILPHSQYVFMAWCFGKHRNNMTFTRDELYETMIRSNNYPIILLLLSFIVIRQGNFIMLHPRTVKTANR
jgi:hypothetical protein